MNSPASDSTTNVVVANQPEIVKPIIDPKVYNQLSLLLRDDWKNCFTKNGLCTMHKEDGSICGKSMDTSSSHSRMKHVYSFHYIEFAQMPKSHNRPPTEHRKTAPCTTNGGDPPRKKIAKKNKTNSFGPEIINFFVASVRANPELLENNQLIELTTFLNEYIQHIKSDPNVIVDTKPSIEQENPTVVIKKEEKEKKKKRKDSKRVEELIIEKPQDNESPILHPFEMDDDKRRLIWNL